MPQRQALGAACCRSELLEALGIGVDAGKDMLPAALDAEGSFQFQPDVVHRFRHHEMVEAPGKGFNVPRPVFDTKAFAAIHRKVRVLVIDCPPGDRIGSPDIGTEALRAQRQCVLQGPSGWRVTGWTCRSHPQP